MKGAQGRFNLVRSGLDLVRELKAPSAIAGEKVLAHSQAAYDAGSISRSWWKLGFLYLTATRLIFTQGDNKLLEIPLNSLSELQIVSRNWIPGKVVQQLRLIKESDGKKSIFYLSVEKPLKWMRTIEAAKKEDLSGLTEEKRS